MSIPQVRDHRSSVARDRQHDRKGTRRSECSGDQYALEKNEGPEWSPCSTESAAGTTGPARSPRAQTTSGAQASKAAGSSWLRVRLVQQVGWQQFPVLGAIFPDIGARIPCSDQPCCGATRPEDAGEAWPLKVRLVAPSRSSLLAGNCPGELFVHDWLHRHCAVCRRSLPAGPHLSDSDLQGFRG